jgi:hypothetical protein
MLEKIKQFFAGIASVTIVLYAIWYIAQYAHDRMLGIAMLDPVREEYLIAGGTFFLSTFMALYYTLLNYWYYYVFFLLAAGAFVYFDRYEQREGRSGIQAVYTLLIIIIIIIFLYTIIPIFIKPLGFQDFLLREIEPIPQTGIFSGIEKELRTWILNENTINDLKLFAFYVLLLFITAFSAMVTYALVRRWQRGGWHPQPKKPLSKLLYDIHQLMVPVFMAIMGFITAVLIILIPINFGVLIKSNVYPEVRVITIPGEELPPERDSEMESKMWLLRESSGELLLHVVYVEKGKTKPMFKILVLKKEQVKAIEILEKSFILEIK